MIRKAKANLFLLELIFAVFFFIIISTICLQVFAKAHTLNGKTTQLNNAIEIIQNEIEIFSTSDEYSTNPVYYDEAWYEVVDLEKAEYILEKEVSSDSDFKYLNVYVRKNDDTSNIIYSQNIMVYIERR